MDEDTRKLLHDIRNELGAALLSMDVLKNKNIKPEYHSQATKNLEHALWHMKGLLEKAREENNSKEQH